MNKLHVKSLNEFFNVDGPDWIVDDPNSYKETSSAFGVWTGKKLSDEHKKNIGNGGRGKRMSPETIERMKIAAKKRGNNRTNTTHTEETKEKMRQSALKRWSNK
jgi:hypothetical protein